MSIAIRPRSVTELFDAAFQVLRAHFSAIALLAAIAALPLMVVGLVTSMILPGAGSIEAATARPGISAGLGLGIGLMSLVAGLWFTVGTSAIIVAAVRAYRGEPVDAGDCLRAARGRFGSVLMANVVKVLTIMGLVAVAGLLTALLAAISPILLVIPLLAGAVGAVYLLLRLFPLTAIATMEAVSGTEAFARTGPLTRGAKGRIASLQLLGFAVLVGLLFVFVAIGGIVGTISPGLSAAVNSVWYVCYAMFAVVQGLFYVDLRVRTEGYDIELMSRQLAGSPADASIQGA